LLPSVPLQPTTQPPLFGRAAMKGSHCDCCAVTLTWKSGPIGVPLGLKMRAKTPMSKPSFPCRSLHATMKWPPSSTATEGSSCVPAVKVVSHWIWLVSGTPTPLKTRA
jgi:hypothetical protein